ncbi:MAG: hypothetical protein U1F43_33385 [Myxococcota bacterium]
MLLLYTWASLLTGKGQALLRIEGATSAIDDLGAGGAAGQTFRAIILIALPPGSDASALAGLTLGRSRWPGPPWRSGLGQRPLARDARSADARGGAAGAHRRLARGDARRGAKGQRVRRFEAGFLALRAPEPNAPMPAPPAVPGAAPGAPAGTLSGAPGHVGPGR